VCECRESSADGTVAVNLAKEKEAVHISECVAPMNSPIDKSLCAFEVSLIGNSISREKKSSYKFSDEHDSLVSIFGPCKHLYQAGDVV
jgi:hypothetical protein